MFKYHRTLKKIPEEWATFPEYKVATEIYNTLREGETVTMPLDGDVEVLDCLLRSIAWANKDRFMRKYSVYRVKEENVRIHFLKTIQSP